jgi:hypothetical protein
MFGKKMITMAVTGAVAVLGHGFCNEDQCGMFAHSAPAPSTNSTTTCSKPSCSDSDSDMGDDMCSLNEGMCSPADGMCSDAEGMCAPAPASEGMCAPGMCGAPQEEMMSNSGFSSNAEDMYNNGKCDTYMCQMNETVGNVFGQMFGNETAEADLKVDADDSMESSEDL